MKISIEGSANEIAALVLAVQERREISQLEFNEMIEKMLKAPNSYLTKYGTAEADK